MVSAVTRDHPDDGEDCARDRDIAHLYNFSGGSSVDEDRRIGKAPASKNKLDPAKLN